MGALANSPGGYADPAYAAALGHIGVPRRLPRCGGSILVREIGDTGHLDGVGPYPLFVCSDWNALGDDLHDLNRDLVSVVLVTDPFGNWSRPRLESSFPDLCRPFKDHFVVDLSTPP